MQEGQLYLFELNLLNRGQDPLLMVCYCPKPVIDCMQECYNLNIINHLNIVKMHGGAGGGVGRSLGKEPKDPWEVSQS